MSDMQTDELILLWQEGTAAEPDPQEISRLAGRAAMRRFDQSVFWRNFLEYAAGLALFAVFGWNLLIGRSAVFSLVAMVCVVLVLAVLWWQHRALTPLDRAADARAYHAALLARIDKQIRLLESYRFWYLMPLSIPLFWGVLESMSGDSFAIGRDLMLLIALFAGTALLNERWGIRRLREERAMIEAIYEE